MNVNQLNLGLRGRRTPPNEVSDTDAIDKLEWNNAIGANSVTTRSMKKNNTKELFDRTNSEWYNADDYSGYATATTGLLNSIKDLFGKGGTSTTSPSVTPSSGQSGQSTYANKYDTGNTGSGTTKKGLGVGAWIGISLAGVAVIGTAIYFIAKARRNKG